MNSEEPEANKLFNDIMQLEELIDKTIAQNGDRQAQIVKLYLGVIRYKKRELSRYGDITTLLNSSSS